MTDPSIAADWVDVAELADLRRRRKMLVTAGTEEIALFYVNDEVYALRDVCIHKGRNISKGLVFKGQVICPGHQWSFDLPTGWNDEWQRCQPTYAVRVDENRVLVLPEPRVRETAPHVEEMHPSRR